MTNDNGIPHGDVASTTGSSDAGEEWMEVSAGVVFRNGLLLVTLRRQKDHLGGLWEFPGGKRNAGESDEDCLKRELMEELGIEVEIKELLETIAHDYQDKRVRLKFFRCIWRKNEPRAIACDDFAWVGRNQLPEYKFPACDGKLLQRLLATPELWRQETGA
jgi:mutator protein MutT